MRSKEGGGEGGSQWPQLVPDPHRLNLHTAGLRRAFHEAIPAGRNQRPSAGRGSVGVGGGSSRGDIDHRKSTLARGSRWDYTPLPF